MKTILRICVLGTGLFIGTSLQVFSYESPPPPPAEHGAGGNQEPAGAPIDGGLGILLALGLGYGGMKSLKAGKTKKEIPDADNVC